MQRLKYSAIALWVVSVATLIYHHVVKLYIPNEILTILSGYPTAFYAEICNWAALALLSIFTVRLLINKSKFLSSILVCAFLLQLLTHYLVWIRLDYIAEGIFIDTMFILYGFTFIQLHSNSKLLTFNSLRICACIVFISLIGLDYISSSTIPSEITQFVKNNDYMTSVLSFIFLILFLLTLFASIGIFFRSNGTKYLIVSSYITMMLIGSLSADALTTWVSICVGFWHTSTGILYGLLFSDSLKDQFHSNDRLKKINIFRTFALSMFSNKFYHEVKTNWKGGGLSPFFALIFVFSIIQLLLFNYEYEQLNFLNDAKYAQALSKLPDIYINKGTITTATNQPILLYDSEKKPFIYINTFSDDSFIFYIPAEIKVLITHQNIFVKKHGHIQAYGDFKRLMVTNNAILEDLGSKKISSANFMQFIKQMTAMDDSGIIGFNITAYLIVLLIIILIASIRNFVKKRKRINLGLLTYLRILTIGYIPYAILSFIDYDILHLNELLVFVSVFMLWGIRTKLGIKSSTFLHNLEASLSHQRIQV